ncbi:MAG: disulfide interchange protein [Chryseobacterium sp.]|jgi:thiol-disulfide isomerase/thioredoxin|nr:disulfide interchange protein [Chryseobacterium sp.]
MKVFFLLMLISGFLSAQNNSNVFEVKGDINQSVAKADSIYLESAFVDPLFYDKNLFSSKIEKGKFYFSGTVNYPTALFLSFQQPDNTYVMTQMVFLDKGSHKLLINEFTADKFYSLSNSDINIELTEKFLPDYNKIIEQEELKVSNKDVVDEKDYVKIREEFRKKKLEYILNYTKKNPNSYISLWFAIERYSARGYDDVFLEIYKYFSKEIKKTKTAKYFFKMLNEKHFERKLLKISLQNINEKKTNYKLSSKYTLIDFWFSNCGPCLIEFPKYKLVKDNYQNMNNYFEIIGISTDLTKNINNWKKIITEKNLNWVQYLDENGIESKKLNIHKFPTNFLLDSEGKILKKDISPDELDNFLKKNIK